MSTTVNICIPILHENLALSTPSTFEAPKVSLVDVKNEEERLLNLGMTECTLFLVFSVRMTRGPQRFLLRFTVWSKRQSYGNNFMLGYLVIRINLQNIFNGLVELE